MGVVPWWVRIAFERFGVRDAWSNSDPGRVGGTKVHQTPPNTGTDSSPAAPHVPQPEAVADGRLGSLAPALPVDARRVTLIQILEEALWRSMFCLSVGPDRFRCLA